jgi:hypothetical protein
LVTIALGVSPLASVRATLEEANQGLREKVNNKETKAISNAELLTFFMAFLPA